MITLEDRAVQIDFLLDKMAAEIQLNKSRYDRMVQSYEAIKKHIEEDEKFFKPFNYSVYPHGSVRIQTSVKPLREDEFDLDIVIHFSAGMVRHEPSVIYSELKRRLCEKSIYKEMLECKNRVLRLNYSGDFHMDIMPGVQEHTWDEDKIRVPDRGRKQWVSSNPKGFAKWFMNKANTVRSSLLERALNSEKIQADSFENKKPLQRAVQLIKRFRDIYFDDKSEYRTSSIILTTIAGMLYQGEDSIFSTIDNILDHLNTKLLLPTRFKVLNPVNKDEDFTDKWQDEPEYYQAFQDFIFQFKQAWDLLKQSENRMSEGDILKRLFGEDLFHKALSYEANVLERLRASNDLGVNIQTGALSSSKISTQQVRKNTFYGE